MLLLKEPISERPRKNVKLFAFGADDGGPQHHRNMFSRKRASVWLHEQKCKRSLARQKKTKPQPVVAVLRPFVLSRSPILQHKGDSRDASAHTKNIREKEKKKKDEFHNCNRAENGRSWEARRRSINTEDKKLQLLNDRSKSRMAFGWSPSRASLKSASQHSKCIA